MNNLHPITEMFIKITKPMPTKNSDWCVICHSRVQEKNAYQLCPNCYNKGKIAS